MTATPRNRRFLLAAGVTLISMAVYIGTLDASFVYDDIIYIVNNPQLEAPWDMFQTSFPSYMGARRGLYRPLTTASLALDYGIFGLEPYGFHLTNILLHGLCTLVAFALFRRIIGGDFASAAGALLLGLHPARSEAVAWAVGRSERPAAPGALLALLLYVRIAEGKRSPIVILTALAAFAFAGLSKENALALPGVLFAYELFIRKGDPWRLRLARLAPFAAVLATIVFTRLAVLGSLGPGQGQQVLPDIVMPERLLLAGWILTRYVLLIFYPGGLKPHYRPLEFQDATALDYLPVLLFLSAGLILAFTNRRFAFAWCLFFIPLIPVLNLIPIGELVAERFLYFPMTGAGLAFGLAAASLGKRRKVIAFQAIATALLVVFAWCTVLQAAVWKDHFTLWSHAVLSDPDDPQAHFGLGVVLIKKGRIEGEGGALAELMKTRTLNPNYKPELVSFHLGRAHEAMGREVEAMGYYEEALERTPLFTLALEHALDLDRNAKEKDGIGLLSKEKQGEYLARLLRLTRDPVRQSEYRRKFTAGNRK